MAAVERPLLGFAMSSPFLRRPRRPEAALFIKTARLLHLSFGLTGIVGGNSTRGLQSLGRNFARREFCPARGRARATAALPPRGAGASPGAALLEFGLADLD